MITEQDLEDGVVFRTTKPLGNVVTECVIWEDMINNRWRRTKHDFSYIGGWQTTEELLALFNKHNFKIVGHWRFIVYDPQNKISPGNDDFSFSGAL